MALLGLKKKQAFDMTSNGPVTTPGISDGTIERMGQYAPGTMQHSISEQRPAKFKPNLLGVIGDAMQVFGGGQATYMQGVREQQERDAVMRQRAMQAQQERETGWQDYVRKQEYERANETQPPTAMARNLETYSGWTDEQKRLYREMNPEYRQGSDGRFYRIDVEQGPAPTFTDDDWNAGQPMGGSGGNATGGFPY